jgi:hypothetical protein
MPDGGSQAGSSSNHGAGSPTLRGWIFMFASLSMQVVIFSRFDQVTKGALICVFFEFLIELCLGDYVS